ncbi:MAG: SDR family NAD(P)-dependent oxidoreductase [Cellvibrionaceae bacterium]|nr:SDR family NAD(P)-dependent oxidoreductase [Cellvibrionaceae bacterium]
MQSKSVLFLGFGDIARRTALRLADCQCVAVARSDRSVKDGDSVEFWRAAADSQLVRARLMNRSFDAVILTLTPDEYTAAAYERAYVETLRNLLPVWQVRPPGLILFVSSTSVYHQSDGDWVNEDSPASPEHFSGQSLLAAETLLLRSGLAASIVRFAGIYGPGRDFLLRQVRAGKGGSADFTNRIHADDCAGVLAYLLRQYFQGGKLDPLYLGCDSGPAPGAEVRRWLAERLGLDPTGLAPSVSERGGNKRCSNRRLLAAGYQMIYPSYREGYGELLASGALG